MNSSSPSASPGNPGGARRPLRTLVGLACAVVLLAGCAAGPRLLRTDVTTFNDWSALPAAKTYTFARTLEYQNSLEVKNYEDVVREELGRAGFTYVAEPSQASLIVTLRPTVTSTHLRLRDPWADPYWGAGFGGPYGGPFGGFYGLYGRAGGFYGPSSYGPGWGASGFYGDRAVDFYQRRLELDIDSRGTPGKRYYEGKVESTGPNESIVTVMPYLIRALFSDFPGNNGQTRRVDVEIPRT